MLSSLVVRFIKGHWGSILPALLRATAEGKFGPQAKAIYWTTAGYRTVTGAVLSGSGVALAHVCSSYPNAYAWACTGSEWLFWAGALLTTVGLVDGGTRAPWPTGTPKE